MLGYRLGLGWLIGFTPVLILSTRHTESAPPRHTPLIHRRHGSKFYVLAQEGLMLRWLDDLRAHPRASVRVGGRSYCVTPHQVTDDSERLRALYMFRPRVPLFFSALTPVLHRLGLLTPTTLRDLSRRTPQVMIVRLDIHDAPLDVPPVPADRAWWWLVIAVGLMLASLIRERLARRY